MQQANKEYLARATYLFKGTILDNPLVISTTRHIPKSEEESKTQFITFLENVPTLTFRAGSWNQEVVAINEFFDKADEEHDRIVKSTVELRYGIKDTPKEKETPTNI